MARIAFFPGRARAVRIASALVLMLVCSGVLGSAVASAASPTTVDLTCSPQNPVAGVTASCETRVSSPGGAPAGNVRIEKFGFADFRSVKCILSPISATESLCDFQFRLTAPGDFGIGATFPGDATHELGADAVEFLVGPGGSIRVECSPEFGVFNLPSTCETFVPNTPGVPAAPSGTVHFQTELGFLAFNGGTGGEIDPECSLETVPGGARCAVTIVPEEIETPVAIIADYEGDGSHPAQFGSLAYLVFGGHPTAISASCGPASTLAPTTCTLTVVNQNKTGGAPAGRAEIIEAPVDGGFPLGSCDLKPVEDGPKATESSCQVEFQPRRTGRQVLFLEYRGASPFRRSNSTLEIEVIDPRITSTGLTCLAQTGAAAGICSVSVRDTSANPIKPTGTVKLNVPAGVKLNRETCELTPSSAKGESGCAFSFRMDAVGSAPVVAEYSGDPKTGHLPSSRQGVISRRS
jgi:hypothetical protein